MYVYNKKFKFDYIGKQILLPVYFAMGFAVSFLRNVTMT